MDEQRWLDAIQETMLVVLSICRLLISREHMSVEKSGIVLMITLVNGADLLALSHSLQYHDIIIERLWMYIGLAILSISLFQLSFIDTDGLTRTAPHSDNVDKTNPKKKFAKRMHFLQDQNICPLFRVSLFHIIQSLISLSSFLLYCSRYLFTMVFYFSIEYFSRRKFDVVNQRLYFSSRKIFSSLLYIAIVSIMFPKNMKNEKHLMRTKI